MVEAIHLSYPIHNFRLFKIAMIAGAVVKLHPGFALQDIRMYFVLDAFWEDMSRVNSQNFNISEWILGIFWCTIYIDKLAPIRV